MWALCVEYYGSGSVAPGQVMAWLDDRWRWGTAENPDLVTAMDVSIEPTEAEKRAAAGLLSVAGGEP